MAEGPFHQYEREVQKLFRVADEALDLGLAMVNDTIGAHAVSFVESMPFVVVSYVDATRQSVSGREYSAWTTMLAGNEGFLKVGSKRKSVDVHNGRLCEETSSESTFITTCEKAKSIPMALMVINFEHRRRYRINGIAEAIHVNPDKTVSFRLIVKEAYGNCPKYIQSRRIVPLLSTTPIAPSTHRLAYLSSRAIKIIEQCDTFFLTTFFNSSTRVCDCKVDITHRGGRPGFLRMVNDHTLIWPDYPGNNMFMTLGNIYGNPRVSLLIMDFDNNAVLTLSGNAELLVSLPSNMKPMDGMNKFVQFTITESCELISNAFPFGFQLLQASPYNPTLQGFVGVKEEDIAGVVSKQLLTEKQSNICLDEVIFVSEDIASFRFSFSEDISYFPGQYVMIHWKIPELDFDGVRSWTITSVPSTVISSQNSIQITIKRVGLITNWLFTKFSHASDPIAVSNEWKALQQNGSFTAELLSIQGDFSVFSASSTGIKAYQFRSSSVQQIVFFSAGIGITPFLSMVKGVLRGAEDIYTRVNFQWFISVRKPADLNVLFDLTSDIVLNTGYRKIEIIVHMTEPFTEVFYPETLNQHYHLAEERVKIISIFNGRLDSNLIQLNSRNYPNETDFYLCGPAEYMKMVSDAIPTKYQNRIFTEDFYF